MNKILVFINKLRYGEVKKLKLREWARLEDIRKQMQEFAERGGHKPVAVLIFKFIEACGVKINHNKAWFDVMALFVEAQQKNLPSVNFPMLKANKGKDVTIPWDYIGRDWYWWVNLFAKNYGWSEEQIAELEIDNAIGLYEEILVDEQLEKEWQYGLSELAYEYVPSTKKSKFRPLERPAWMLVTKENMKKKPIIKTKILASMMPIGNIVQLDEE